MRLISPVELHAEVAAVAPGDAALHLGAIGAEIENDPIGQLLGHTRRLASDPVPDAHRPAIRRARCTHHGSRWPSMNAIAAIVNTGTRASSRGNASLALSGRPAAERAGAA